MRTHCPGQVRAANMFPWFRNSPAVDLLTMEVNDVVYPRAAYRRLKSVARFASTCPVCGSTIAKGDRIRQASEGWGHARCVRAEQERRSVA
jgi:hypothetical protein